MTKKNDWKRLSVYITEQDWQMLHLLSGKQMTSISEFVRALIQEGIESYRGNLKEPKGP